VQESVSPELEDQVLDASASLCAETYNDDPDLRQLTEAALAEWPE
jgi:hypothetical protein